MAKLGQFGETNPNFSEGVERLVRQAALDNPNVYCAMKFADNHDVSLEDALGHAVYMLVQQNKTLFDRTVKYTERYGKLPDVTASVSPTLPCQ